MSKLRMNPFRRWLYPVIKGRCLRYKGFFIRETDEGENRKWKVGKKYFRLLHEAREYVDGFIFRVLVRKANTPGSP